MRNELPEIVKTANQLLHATELQVQRFPRKYKYRIGERLVDGAFEISALAYEAWCDRDRRAHLAADLDAAITRFKIAAQLAQRLQAFTSLGAFTVVARLVQSLGRQCGGWRKGLQGQSSPASAPAGSAQILSSRPASFAEAGT